MIKRALLVDVIKRTKITDAVFTELSATVEAVCSKDVEGLSDAARDVAHTYKAIEIMAFEGSQSNDMGTLVDQRELAKDYARKYKDYINSNRAAPVFPFKFYGG